MTGTTETRLCARLGPVEESQDVIEAHSSANAAGAANRRDIVRLLYLRAQHCESICLRARDSGLPGAENNSTLCGFKFLKSHSPPHRPAALPLALTRNP
jgi:hypothetical protein